ncbi:MAG: glycine cleavage system protein H [Planctomycetota bacterium]
MAYVADWLKSGLLLLGFALAATVAFALLAVFAIAMRPLLILGFVLAAMTAAVLSIFSSAFRDWFEAAGEPETHHSGLRLATDVAVHPSHSWARMAPKDVAVGADDFVQATLGPVEAVELPPVGTRVEQGDRLFFLRRGNRRVAVRAPVSGTVIDRNESLLARPEIVNEAPFTRGWAVRLQAENVPAEGNRLLRGKQARGWFRGEIDRLMMTVLADDALARALPDGGTLTGELYRHIDDLAWAELTETFFGSADAQADCG